MRGNNFSCVMFIKYQNMENKKIQEMKNNQEKYTHFKVWVGVIWSHNYLLP